MFTGIVEEQGRVRLVTAGEGGARLEIEADRVLDDAAVGASIALNGCCLTVVATGPGWWAADAQLETLTRTTLGALRAGDPVNLERPLRPVDRIGGHVVQGHVDATGTVVAVEPRPDGSTCITVSMPPRLARYVVEKGSIAIDGVSLTVTAVADEGPQGAHLSVALIPHTLAVTTLGVRRPGDPVNLEVDVLAKQLERLVTHMREP